LNRKYPAGTRMAASRIVMISFFDTGLMSKQFLAKRITENRIYL